LNLLFLSTSDSCRSILAEAAFNHLAPAGCRAGNASSQSAGYAHPRSLALLAAEGSASWRCCARGCVYR
jgi:arsenate reductase